MSPAKSAPKRKEPLVKVTALHPYQIGHAGKVAGPGESLTVPVSVADQWRTAGLIK